MKKKDNISIIVDAALAEGLSYGKYMVKYNYDPPCIKKPKTEEPAPIEKAVPKSEPILKVRICPQCGKEFRTVRRTYCSTDCQQDHKRKYDQKRIAQIYIDRKEKIGVRYCAVCGKQIPIERRMTAVTCSKECSTMRKNRRWSEYGNGLH